MIIAIDGPSGSGKGTVAKAIAEALHFTHVDTGAMYRALTWHCLNSNLTPEKGVETFNYRCEGGRHFVGDHDVTDVIRSQQVTREVSRVSAPSHVRDLMVAHQRHLGEQGSAVFEGRDIGTTVFPYAPVKIFLTASPEERAKRRFLQLDKVVPLEQILADQERRDHLDSTRECSPTRPADGAVTIDTTNLTIDQVVDTILEIVRRIPT